MSIKEVARKLLSNNNDNGDDNNKEFILPTPEPCYEIQPEITIEDRVSALEEAVLDILEGDGE